MRFHILNVGHGFCAYVLADNGNLMVFDCGHSTDPEFRPSEFLQGQGIRSVQRLFISNYDQDHISDLPNLCCHLRIEILHRNRSISPGELRSLKQSTGAITSAMELLLEMMDTYTTDVTQPPQFPGVSWASFHARYRTDFNDTNNLSLVTFLNCNGLRVVLPGDLEREGW